MSAAQHPARQLNSKSIRDAATSYLIPEVQGKFCMISATCIWRVEDNPASLAKSWELICDKREECDSAIEDLPGVAFFFSSITASDSTVKKKGKNALTNDSEEYRDEEGNATPSQTVCLSQLSTSSAISAAIQKGRLPTIVYWIALESPNGAPVSLVRLQRSLLKCDVEIDTKVLSSRPGTAAAKDITKRLCVTLKDHNSSYISEMVNDSFEECFKSATSHLDIDLDDAREEMAEHVVRFVVVSAPNTLRLKTAVDALVKAGLQLSVRGLDSATTKCSFVHNITTDVCTQLIHDIEALMGRLGYAVHQGMILKKHPESRYTFKYKCDINTFLGALEGNEAFKPRLIKYGDKIRDKLRNPKSQLIQQLHVMYDLIEVGDGWCLNLTKHEFEKVSLEIGKSSPRAFFNYDRNSPPNAMYFQEILQNSLSEDEISNFCTDFLGLLKFQQKGHKEKVPCLVGQSNSGKTSLFAPLLGIIPSSRIARVTKQRSFNKAMINENTEVIFIDEASVGIMDIDDWKLLTQGGWTAIDRKFSTARGFINRCPMLIACQTELRFPAEDQPAMNARLNTYRFQSLPKTEPMAFDWLRSHPVECIVWAMNHSRQNVTPSSAVSDEIGTLSLSEACELRTFTVDPMIEEELPSIITIPSEEDENQLLNESDDANMMSTVETIQSVLEKEASVTNPKSFRGRLIKKLSDRNNKDVSREKEEMRRMTVSRQRRLIEEGIVTSDEAQEYVVHPYGELPPHIQQRRFDLIAKEREDERQRLKRWNAEEAVRVYQDPWVIKKERELKELAMKTKVCLDIQVRKSIENLIDITESKLKQYHELRGTLTVEALTERRKFCLSSGYVDKEMAHLILNVYQRMPEVVQLTPPRSENGENTIKTPEVPQQTSSTTPHSHTPLLEISTTPHSEIPLLAPPKTPSWTPRPFRRPLQLFHPQEGTPSNKSPDVATPKTPSWSPLTQRTPRKATKRMASKETQQRKKTKYSITDYFSLDK